MPKKSIFRDFFLRDWRWNEESPGILSVSFDNAHSHPENAEKSVRGTSGAPRVFPLFQFARTRSFDGERVHCRGRDYAPSNRIDLPMAHVCLQRIDIWMSGSRHARLPLQEVGQKHLDRTIFRASNMSVDDFDFSPASGPRRLLHRRCSITDSDVCPPSRKKKSIIASYRLHGKSPRLSQTDGSHGIPQPVKSSHYGGRDVWI